MLNPHISGLSIEILEGETELSRIVILSFTQLQESHVLHELMQHVIIHLVPFEVSVSGGHVIISSHERVPEGGDMEELLDHTIHVADAAKVTDTAETIEVSTF